MFEEAIARLPVLDAWLRNYRAGGAQPQPQPGGAPAKVDEATYAAMSARDKMFYCRQFKQPDYGSSRR